ncbi:hypothetical protein AFCDBAGC_0356 [Methylobacterium cerastii]|uniref:Uncharacterized protein n=1 Tax=Methylobacterium cerastii TaxID=932741 RepID=A0ABQ4QBD2_9HYPH|nr:hypothetical protein AFCDBAGC_0356 [Methylobacterium cerastii]
MSGTTVPLNSDLEEQLGRIHQQREESEKFVAE